MGPEQYIDSLHDAEVAEYELNGSDIEESQPGCPNCLEDGHSVESCPFCPDCGGEGGMRGITTPWLTCKTCNGSGEKDVTESLPGRVL